MNESSIHERGHATESELDAMRDRRPTRWDALPERRLSTPYTRTRATRYSSPNQVTGPQNEATEFDFQAIYTNKVEPQEAKIYTEWRAMFQNAADDFLITPWNPHPDECPSTPCPPCEE